MEIVKNACYGEFGLSDAALARLSDITGLTFSQCMEKYSWGGKEIRTAPELVQVVKELGIDANGDFAELKVVEVPDSVNWCINDYDGWETIEEVHRSW